MGRKLGRTAARVRLLQAARELARAEAELGLLGWQQADFLTDEMREQVERIVAFEKQEADVFNDEAALADRAREIEAEQSSAAEKQRARLERLHRDRDEAARAKATAAAATEEKRRHAQRLDQALHDLERDSAELDQLAARLLAIGTREARAEWQRLLVRRQTSGAELEDLRRAKAERASELTGAEAALGMAEQRFAEAEAAVSEAAEAAYVEARRFEAALAGIQQDRKKSHKRLTALDTEKRIPFRHIGRCLADSGIAPRNQPDALHRVQAARTSTQNLEEQITESNTRSAAADRQAVTAFYVIGGTAVGAAASIGVALLK